MKSPITLLAGIVLILGGVALGAFSAFQWVHPQIFQADTQILARKPGGTGVHDPLFLKAEVERIQSSAVLTNFIADLNLNDVWGKKYNGGKRLSDGDVQQMLKIDVRPVRNSELIRIQVRSDDPGEAAALANAIVRSYRVQAAQSKVASVSVLMFATPPTRADNPNRPMLMMFIAAGVFMAIGGIYCLKESTSGSKA